MPNRLKTGQLYKDYLASAEWQAKAEASRAAANYTCQRCGRSKSKEPRLVLQVHHVTYSRVGRELPEDLLVVCKRCHCELHNRKIKRAKKRKNLLEPVR